MVNNNIQNAMEISARFEKDGRDALTEEEFEYLKKIRSNDNEKMVGILEKGVAYYISDRGGAFKFEPTIHDVITVEVDGKKYSIEEYFNGFKDLPKTGVEIRVDSEIEVELWDEEKDFTIKKPKQFYNVANYYTFTEVTCIYKSFIENK